MAKTWKGTKLYTLGHSTRSLDELVELLEAFGISTLADIRTVPRSRKNPQFNTDALARDLPSRGYRYAHLPRLGGLRKTRKDSPNEGWRNLSFRGYADHLLTDEFEAGLEELRALASGSVTTVMCAEAVPWRCHRSLVADVVTVRGGQAEHITSPKRASAHRLTAFARVDGERITYPEEGPR